MNSPPPSSAQTALLPALHGCDFISRNFRVNGRRTSIRLERAMWQAFEDIARRENRPVRELCATIDLRRHGSNLTAAVRLFIIGYFRLATLAQDDTPSRPTTEAGFAENDGVITLYPPQQSPLMQAALQAIA